MAVGRLAWSTPTGAQLWEIWGRHKLHFAGHGIAFLASLLCARWIQHGVSDIPKAVLGLVLLSAFLGSYLDLLTCFGYIETDARRVQIGFPGRLLLKPVSTLRLALVPVLFGGAAVVAVLLLWNEFVLQPLGRAIPLDPLWLGALMLSGFWWIQALAWSLPQFPGRSLITFLVAVTHLLIGLMPLMPVPISAGLRWLILAIMLLSALAAALVGLAWMRRGTWESPSRIAEFWKTLRPARSRPARKGFGSAFRAQFWLEWQRQGVLLPGMAGGIAFLVFPIVFVVQKQTGESGQGGDFEIIAATLALVIPIIISNMLAPALARFDQLQPTGELPVYIAMRPMTNGGFVMAKAAMSLASGAMTWLVMAVVTIFWLAILGKGILLTKISPLTPYGLGAFVIGCVPVLLLLILWTWKNSMSGIAAGLTGRTWVGGVYTLWRFTMYGGIVTLVFAAKISANLKEILLHLLPFLLVACLATKIVFSIATFIWGLRRKVITGGAVGAIAGGWLVCGLFVIGYAGLVCHALNQPHLWVWITLAGLLMLPLADLALAPLALAWNRHR